MYSRVTRLKRVTDEVDFILGAVNPDKKSTTRLILTTRAIRLLEAEFRKKPVWNITD